MSKLDLANLKLLATKATPGPWWVDSHGHHMVSQAGGDHKTVFITNDSMGPATRHPETGNLSHWPNDWDASFIAVVNPKTVLELLQLIEGGEAKYSNMLSQREAVAENLRFERELSAAEKQQRHEVSALLLEFRKMFEGGCMSSALLDLLTRSELFINPYLQELAQHDEQAN